MKVLFPPPVHPMLSLPTKIVSLPVLTILGSGTALPIRNLTIPPGLFFFTPKGHKEVLMEGKPGVALQKNMTRVPTKRLMLFSFQVPNFVSFPPLVP